MISWTLLPPDPDGVRCSAGRAWRWVTCKEMGLYQVGNPDPSKTTLVSSVLGPEYYERQCQLMFPEAFPQPPIPNTNRTNTKYGGWDIEGDRIIFTTGDKDPFREATVSAKIRNPVGTQKQRIETSENGFFASDFNMAGRIDPGIAAVQDKVFSSIRTWLAAWPEYQRKLKNGGGVCRARNR